jgi:hypothetical protein
MAAQLHREEHVARAQQQLSDLIRDLLAEATATGAVRDDVPPEELATYGAAPATRGACAG